MAVFKTEPGYTPRRFRGARRDLPALGHHATFRPATNHVQKPKQNQRRRPQNQPLRSLNDLSPEEQVSELRKSRKAIKSKLYGRIARLQVCFNYHAP
jgi:hypothetical protein